MGFRVLAVVLAATLSVTFAAEAFAKAGKGSSMGSRGDRTYDRPIERSIAPPAPTAPQMAPAAPGAAQPMYNPNAVRPQPGMAAPAAAPMQQPGFFQRNPFLGGIMGGLVGAGIGSMLFGHSPAMAAAGAASPMGSMLGTLLQIALIGGLAYLGYRLFARKAQTAGSDLSAPYQREAAAPMGAQAAARVAKEFEPSAADQEMFTQIITGVQKAWSDGNPVAIRQLVTPEVAGWMGEDLAKDQSAGVRNVMEDVQLLAGDVTEAWREGEREYVTARITFSAKDYTVRLSDGQVVDGDRNRPVESTELWTFLRVGGGSWLLSAIEQV
ncbi:putative Translation initiation factor IF-2 [Magnetospirillum sp. LM-5]|uniref:Tim44 domain-containing protein n=1 Tax=Magnetospirillum sp. LM-5 TaxID=2681466 RepID=UPI00137D2B17|nr:TIM44-like domain-containing protein [Magnetospirillum sp. LM-5]CAA7617269.1 putative Translation initiation factor IF-2 [Magnetospirillum sp. LM-5]